MKQHSLIAFFFCFLCVGSLAAQNTLIGTIKDAQTGKPIANAVVTLDYEKKGVLSDSNGVFRLSVLVDIEHLFTVRYLGYKSYSLRVPFNGETKIEVLLESVQNQIAEVIVSSQASVRTVESPSLGVNLLSLKSVLKLPPAAGEIDLFRGLQMLPGVSSVGEGSNGVNVRGGNVDQNWIFIDNMPIFNPSHLLGLFSIFPADALREVQLYKGSIPARYGGRAASVMDVKMIEPSTEQFKVKGGIGMISNRLNMEIPLIKEKLAILTSVRLSYNQYLINFYNKFLKKGSARETAIPDHRASFYDIANKILYRPNAKNTITFSNYLSNDHYEANGLFSISEGLADNTVFSYGHQNFGLRWNRYFNPNLNFNLSAVSSRYANTTTVPKGTAPLDLTTQLNYKNLRAELTYIPTPKHKINTGVSLIRYDLDPADLQPKTGTTIVAPLTLQHENAYETALYFSDEYEMSNRILLEAGFRAVLYADMGAYNLPIYAAGEPKTLKSITGTETIGKGKIEQAYFCPEPRLALRYKLGAYNSVKIGYNRMNQFLHLISNTTTPLPNARWKLSNRYIRPQQSDLVTVGYFQDKPTSLWEYSIEAYYRKQTHVFDYLTAANLQINTNIETQLLDGRGKAYGAELLLTKKRGTMTGWLSYTYARSLQQILGDVPAQQQLNDGDWFPANVDKPHNFNVLMNFQNNKYNSLSLTFVYSTGRPYTAPVGSYRTLDYSLPIFDGRNNSRISNYHRLDFAWTITPVQKRKHWSSNWVFTVYNVYGRKNAYSYFYKNQIFGLKPYKISVFPAPLLSLSYNGSFE